MTIEELEAAAAPESGNCVHDAHLGLNTYDCDRCNARREMRARKGRPMTDEEFRDIEARVAALMTTRDEATADAEGQIAGMREVALFRAANAQGCLGQMTPYLLDQLRLARGHDALLASLLRGMRTHAAHDYGQWTRGMKTRVAEALGECPDCEGSGIHGGPGGYYDAPGKGKPCGTCSRG